MQQRVHRVVLVSVDGVYGDACGVALAGLGASVDVHIDRCADLLGGSPEGLVPFVAVGQTLRRRDPDVDTPQSGLDEPPHLRDGVIHVPEGDHSQPPVPVRSDAAEVNHPVVVDAQMRLLEFVVIDQPCTDSEGRVEHLGADAVECEVLKPLIGVPAARTQEMVRLEWPLFDL